MRRAGEDVDARGHCGYTIVMSTNDTDRNGELSAEWKDEILRRSREMDEGAVALAEAEEVFARAYAKLP